MKELKKFLNKSTDIIYKFILKLANIIKDEKNSLLINAILKLTILCLIYFLCSIMADGLIQIGVYIIHQVATTGRTLLSNIWQITVNLTLFVFIIISLYRLTNIASKDNKFFTIYENKKKDKEVKKKIFPTIHTIIKTLGTIILIPLFIGDIASLFILGIMVGYLRKGIYLISLFTIVIGLILFFTSIILMIKKLLSIKTNNLKQNLISIIISGILIAASSIGILFETSNYKINPSLTADFNISTLKYEYKMDTNKDYIILNNGYDKNLKFTIDEDLGSYIEIIIKHSTTSEVNTNIKYGEEIVNISLNQELNIEKQDLKNILNLGISCIQEKTIYNYTLLKYAEIEVRTSSKYADKIKFVDIKGKEYNPYERTN